MALDPLLVIVVTLGLLGVLVAGFVVASRIRRRKAQPAAEQLARYSQRRAGEEASRQASEHARKCITFRA